MMPTSRTKFPPGYLKQIHTALLLSASPCSAVCPHTSSSQAQIFYTRSYLSDHPDRSIHKYFSKSTAWYFWQSCLEFWNLPFGNCALQMSYRFSTAKSDSLDQDSRRGKSIMARDCFSNRKLALGNKSRGAIVVCLSPGVNEKIMNHVPYGLICWVLPVPTASSCRFFLLAWTPTV